MCDTGNCGMLQLWPGIRHSQGWHCVPPPTRYTCGVQRGVCLFRYHAKVICTLCAIIFLPCDFYLLSFFPSPNLSCRKLDVYHTSTVHTWCGLSANLECMSEMCCTRLAENTGRRNDAKIAIWAPLHNFVALYQCIFATKACIDNRKKNLSNSNMSFTRPHNMANLGPLTVEICWRVWGTPANFNGFCVLASLLQRCRSP